ncbi:MAG: hypothetical protein HUU06_05065 [Planctomycetaceae bacterium]|nr:hypothetical protein [Planctomycetota bacterium]NUN52144.1 hypothetical protein [Planctomycetaceae bacterium]
MRLAHGALVVAAGLGLCLAATPAPGSAAPAETPDGKAAALFTEYRELLRETAWKKVDRRFDILRAMGGLSCATARESLLRVLPIARTGDEKVLAILALGRIADRDAVEKLAAAAAKGEDPVLLQALSKGLEQLQDAGARAWVGGEGLASAKGGLLRALIRGAGRLQLEGAADRIAALYGENAGKKGEIDLCHDAVRAMGEIGGAKGRVMVMAAAAHPEWRIRMAAAEALPRLPERDGEAEDAFRRVVEEGHPVVRRVAVRAAAEGKWEEVVPYVIEVLKDERLAVRKATHDALVAFSGKDLGFDPGTWSRWWKDRAEGRVEIYTVGDYYGLHLWSDRVVFVVDTSGSMTWPWRKDPKRIEVARSELSRALGLLPKTCLFNMVAFSSKVRPWQPREEVPATPANVEQARAWAEKVLVADGDTWTYAVLRDVFAKNPEFDSLYFLSDGAPSDGEYITPEGIVAQVEVWNRYRRVVIHTIGLTLEDLDRGMPNLAEDLHQMRGFMKALAAATGGECRIVTQVPRR